MVERWRQRWAAAVDRWSDQPALISAAERISYRRLAAEAVEHCRRYEARPGWHVGCCVAWPWQHGRQDLPRLLGLWLAGGVWIACPHGADPARRQLAARLTQSCRGPEHGDSCWQLILFSSGSTGAPKVLVRGWRQALAEADAYGARLGLPPGSKAHMLVRPWFGAATKHLLAGLLQGWCQCLDAGLGPDRGQPHPAGVLYATPSQLLQLGAAPASAIRFDWISLTGEACGAGLWPLLQSWGTPAGRCLNAFGATETGVIAEQVLPLAAAWQPFAGCPAPGKRIDLVDDRGQSLSLPDAVGLVRVCGDALIEGELQERAQGWCLQPTQRIAASMVVVTADLARWSAEGLLVLLGRSSQLIKRHGEWLDTAPLQALIEELPGVRRCQLLAEADAITAWLELQTLSPRALRRTVRRLEARLADRRLLPRAVRALAAFPQNANGKLDLASLRAAAEQPGSLGELCRAPAGRDATLAGPLDDLDSLDQAQLVARLQAVNLLWCGAGLQALAAGLPPAVGLIGMPMAAPPLTWSVGGGGSLEELAAVQVQALRQISGDQLGEALWLGGFSLPGWLAYAMATHLRSQGQAVAGVILLDPPDPFSGIFRWPWRRHLADRWRRLGRVRRQRHHSDLWLRQKAWNQQLLGRWNPQPLDAELLLCRSRWRRRLPLARACWFHPAFIHVDLPCRDHRKVLRNQPLIAIWQRAIWTRMLAGGGAQRR